MGRPRNDALDGESWVSHGVWGGARVAHMHGEVGGSGVQVGGAPRAFAKGLRCSGDARGTRRPSAHVTQSRMTI